LDTLIETTKISEKGQIVIPKDVRELLSLESGTRLILIATNDAVILQKTDIASSRLKIKEIIEKAKTVTDKMRLTK
jgi:AbrB family looped-hinge helix DNA binding protein|tara:strand:- start:275 stop:502 length:228 start_codon:yes stop_codon:yes gene_type:complete